MRVLRESLTHLKTTSPVARNARIVRVALKIWIRHHQTVDHVPSYRFGYEVFDFPMETVLARG
jgi:hypothetical protein